MIGANVKAEQLREFDASADDSDLMFQEMLTTLVEYLH